MSLSRRQVMIGAAGSELSLSLLPARRRGSGRRGRGRRDACNPWVSIGTDGTIWIMSPATEMGQGSMTSLPRIIAEELDADWGKVGVVPAPPIDAIYGNPGFAGMLYTAGSNAVTNYFTATAPLGAVRRVLLDNAATNWNVPVSELTTEPSVVVHAPIAAAHDLWRNRDVAVVPSKGARDHTSGSEEDKRVPSNRPRHAARGIAQQGQWQRAIRDRHAGARHALRAVLRAPVEGQPDRSMRQRAAPSSTSSRSCVCLWRRRAWRIRRGPRISAKRALSRHVTWTRAGTAGASTATMRRYEFAAAARDLQAPASPWDKQGDAHRAKWRKPRPSSKPTILSDYAYHAQMEPLNAVAIGRRGDTAEIWCGTQSQTMAQEAVAKVLGIPREKVKLHDMLMGGGFGRRGHRDEEFIVDAVLMAKAAGKPVKVIWTREDDVHNGRMRPLSAHYLRAGVNANGKIVAWHQRIAVDRVLPFADPVRYKNAMGRDGIVMRGTELSTYDIPQSVERTALPRHRRAHLAVARCRVDRQYLRRRSLPGRPKGKEGHWKRHTAVDVTDNESPTFGDLIGDGKAGNYLFLKRISRLRATRLEKSDEQMDVAQYFAGQ